VVSPSGRPKATHHNRPFLLDRSGNPQAILRLPLILNLQIIPTLPLMQLRPVLARLRPSDTLPQPHITSSPHILPQLLTMSNPHTQLRALMSSPHTLPQLRTVSSPLTLPHLHIMSSPLILPQLHTASSPLTPPKLHIVSSPLTLPQIHTMSNLHLTLHQPRHPKLLMTIFGGISTAFNPFKSLSTIPPLNLNTVLPHPHPHPQILNLLINQKLVKLRQLVTLNKLS